MGRSRKVMYNGVGLTTARGSATNGFIQRNVAYRPTQPQHKRVTVRETSPPKIRKPNQAILDHQRKREVELKLVEWADENGIYDLPEEEQDEKLSEKREELISLQERGLLHGDKQLNDTHLRLEAKNSELQAMRNAFRVKDTYQEGDAFSAEVQAKKKQQRY